MQSEQQIHWLDRVLSVPVMGIAIVPNFNIVFNLYQALLSIIHDKYRNTPEVEISFSQAGLSHYIISLSSGYTFDILHNNFIVKFKYGAKGEAAPGKLPIIKEQSIIEYSKLLDNVEELFVIMVDEYIRQSNSIEVIRIGIASYCDLDINTAPDGILELFNHFGKKWKAPLIKTDISLLVPIYENEKYIDRCHHIFKFDNTLKPNDLSFSLDWQRAYLKPTEFNKYKLKILIKESKSRAYSYFHNVGIGEYSYADPAN